jgi:hypothetical protein
MRSVPRVDNPAIIYKPIVYTSLTLRQEHRLRVFGPRDEVTGGWRKLHIKELRNVYPSTILIRITK